MFWVSFTVDNQFSQCSFKRRAEARSFFVNLCNLVRGSSTPCVVKFWSNTECEELCRNC